MDEGGSVDLDLGLLLVLVPVAQGRFKILKLRLGRL